MGIHFTLRKYTTAYLPQQRPEILVASGKHDVIKKLPFST